MRIYGLNHVRETALTDDRKMEIRQNIIVFLAVCYSDCPGDVDYVPCTKRINNKTNKNDDFLRSDEKKTNSGCIKVFFFVLFDLRHFFSKFEIGKKKS